MVSSKYELLNQIASKVQVLDNPIKLKILAMLVEEGSKSVTDISKEMSLNFSTAHKYLEQLEAAGLVTSKQVSENRLKRIFSIGDFNMDISPHGLSNFLNQKKVEPKKTFKVINERGEEVQFDEKIFSQKYIKRGMPARTINNALDKVAEQAYDGITLLELRELFRQEMAKKLETITNVMEMIEESEIRGRTYYNLLKLNHPEALKMHMDGDIFIKNLREPDLLKISHDIRAIYLHGGVEGKRKAKDFNEVFNYISGVINATLPFAKDSHILDSFNYFLAPLAGENLSAENIAYLKRFLSDLKSKSDEYKIKFYLGLEFGIPKWAKEISPYYFTEERELINYRAYEKTAKAIAIECLKYLNDEKPNNIRPILKVWDKEFSVTKLPIEHIPNVFIANMGPAWQTINASYSAGARFDARWKNWMRTVKVAELQSAVINLPRLAYRAKSEGDFLKNLDTMIKQVIEHFYGMAELIAGEFLRQKTSFKSAQKEQWDCVHIKDSTYSIAVTGLDETVFALTSKRITENMPFAEKILHECQKLINKYNKVPLRIDLKEETDSIIAERFHKLDSKLGINAKAYAAGVSCKDPLLSASLHRYLLGGHCLIVPRKDFDFAAFAKAGGGLVKLNG